MKRLTLRIGGMSCGGCVERVRAAIEKAGGRAQVEIGKAEIEFDEQKQAAEQFVEALEKIGFEPAVSGGGA